MRNDSTKAVLLSKIWLANDLEVFFCLTCVKCLAFVVFLPLHHDSITYDFVWKTLMLLCQVCRHGWWRSHCLEKRSASILPCDALTLPSVSLGWSKLNTSIWHHLGWYWLKRGVLGLVYLPKCYFSTHLEARIIFWTAGGWRHAAELLHLSFWHLFWGLHKTSSFSCFSSLHHGSMITRMQPGSSSGSELVTEVSSEFGHFESRKLKFKATNILCEATFFWCFVSVVSVSLIKALKVEGLWLDVSCKGSTWNLLR